MRTIRSIIRGRGAPALLVALGVIVLARSHAAPPPAAPPPPLAAPLDIDAHADGSTETPLHAVAWLGDRQLVGAGGRGLLGVFDLDVAAGAKTSAATAITPAGTLRQSGPPTAVFSLAALADGVFAWGDDSGAVRLGQPPRSTTIAAGASGPGLLVRYDGPDEAAAAYGSSVTLLTLAEDQPPRVGTTLPAATGLGPITALAGAGGLVAAGDAAGKIAVWDAAAGSLLGMVEAPQPIAALAFDADDPPVLVSGHANGQVITWEPPSAPPADWSPAPIGDVAALAAETEALLATNEAGKSKLVRLRRGSGGATTTGDVGDGGAMVPTGAVAVRDRAGDTGRVAAVFNDAPTQLRVFKLDGSGEVTTTALVPAVYPAAAAKLAISGTQVYAVLADGSVHRRDIAAAGALSDARLIASKGSALGAPRDSGPVLVGQNDGAVAAFQPDTAGTPIPIAARGPAAIDALCPLPGGDPRKLALAAGGTISVWDGDHEIQRFVGLATPIRDLVAFEDGDHRVILGVLDKDLQVRYRVVAARSAGVAKPGAGVTALAVVGKEAGRRIVAGLNDGGVCLLPAGGGPVALDVLSEPPAPVAAVQAEPDRITAVSGKFLGVWKRDSTTMRLVLTAYELRSSPGALASLAVGPNGVIAAGLDTGGTVLLRPGDETDDPPRLVVARPAGGSIRGALFDGRGTPVSASSTGEATAWPGIAASAAVPDPPARISRLDRTDAATLAAAALSGKVFAIDPADLGNPRTLYPTTPAGPGAPPPVWSLAAGRAGGARFLAFSGDDRQLHLISDQGKVLFEDGNTVHDGRISALALTANGLRLASGASDRLVKLWDITPSGTAWKTAAAAKQPAQDIFNGVSGAVVAALGYEPKPANPRLAVAAGTRLLVLASDGAALFQNDVPAEVADLAWSPDGSALAVATAGGHLLVYSVP